MYYTQWLEEQIRSGHDEYQILINEKDRSDSIWNEIQNIDWKKVFFQHQQLKLKQQALEYADKYYLEDIAILSHIDRQSWIKQDGYMVRNGRKLQICWHEGREYYYDEKNNSSYWELPLSSQLIQNQKNQLQTEFLQRGVQPLTSEEKRILTEQVKEQTYQNFCTKFKLLQQEALDKYESAWTFHHQEWLTKLGKTVDMGQFHPDTILEVNSDIPYLMRRISNVARHSPFSCWTCTRCKLIFHKSSRPANANPHNLWLYPSVNITLTDCIQLQGDFQSPLQAYATRGARNIFQRIQYSQSFLGSVSQQQFERNLAQLLHQHSIPKRYKKHVIEQLTPLLQTKGYSDQIISTLLLSSNII